MRVIKFVGIFLLVQAMPLIALGESRSNHRYVGVASCASSNCHGSMSPRNATSVLQNEYVTWLKDDSHSQAWKTLLTPKSARIAWQLGINDASQDKTCLQCHSTFVPENGDRGDKFKVEDGVSCESCHGAAEKWLPEHASTHNSHSENIARGLAALEDPGVRSKNCLRCHQGDDNTGITHRIYGAGHPRLSFELDTYSALQPYHWLEDKDYQQRKVRPTPLALWYAGQVSAAQQQVNGITSMLNSSSHLFPELSVFNCYSCHHSLTDDAFLHYDYRLDPGHPPLNLSSVEMVEIALNSLGDSAGKRLASARTSLSLKNSTIDTKKALKQIADLLLEKATLPEISSILPQLLRSLIHYGSINKSLHFESAEQIAMAIESIEAAQNPTGKRSRQLDLIFSTLNSPKEFNPQHFSQQCQQYF